MRPAWTLLFLGLSMVSAKKRCCPELKKCFTDLWPFCHLPLPLCMDDVRPYGIMYTRENKEGMSIDMATAPPIFSSSKRAVFITHGFLTGGGCAWLRTMREGLLRKADVTVIVVGWEDGAVTLNYFQAAANVRTVGTFIARIAQNLVENHHLDRSNLWCIGHSLGGHACGLAGVIIKFGRITGLDPAGPLFENYPPQSGLHKEAADYVDVIHTMGKNGFVLTLGTLRPLGHADFYPNGGGVQPGCLNYLDSTSGVPNISLNPLCSHLRAIDLFQESLEASCVFYARQECRDERNIPGSCSLDGSGGYQIMGYGSDTVRKKGTFYLTTNSAEPFCRG